MIQGKSTKKHIVSANIPSKAHILTTGDIINVKFAAFANKDKCNIKFELNGKKCIEYNHVIPDKYKLFALISAKQDTISVIDFRSL